MGVEVNMSVVARETMSESSLPHTVGHSADTGMEELCETERPSIPLPSLALAGLLSGLLWWGIVRGIEFLSRSL